MYFITTVSSVEFPSSTRCIGFTKTFEEADSLVRVNAGDMNETCYDYAVVEHSGPGIYPVCRVEQWYQFYTEGGEGFYRPIPTPEEVKDTINFAIG